MVGKIRNWRIELTPDTPIMAIEQGKWIEFEFEVFAADEHLPDFLNIHVEVEGSGQLHVLDKRAYSGSDGSPQVDLCFRSNRLINDRVPWTSDGGILDRSRRSIQGRVFILLAAGGELKER